jgi:hypothetical protein
MTNLTSRAQLLLKRQPRTAMMSVQDVEALLEKHGCPADHPVVAWNRAFGGTTYQTGRSGGMHLGLNPKSVVRKAKTGRWLCEFGKHHTAPFRLMMDSEQRIVIDELEKEIAGSFALWMEREAYFDSLARVRAWQWISDDLQREDQEKVQNVLGLKPVPETVDDGGGWYKGARLHCRFYIPWSDQDGIGLWTFCENKKTAKQTADRLNTVLGRTLTIEDYEI